MATTSPARLTRQFTRACLKLPALLVHNPYLDRGRPSSISFGERSSGLATSTRTALCSCALSAIEVLQASTVLVGVPGIIRSGSRFASRAGLLSAPVVKGLRERGRLISSQLDPR